MRYFDTLESIYENIDFGMTVGYWKHFLGDESPDIIEGIVTDITECDSFSDCCRPCRFQIAIDHQKPDCYRFGNNTALKYVYEFFESEFFDQKEFIL